MKDIDGTRKKSQKGRGIAREVTGASSGKMVSLRSVQGWIVLVTNVHSEATEDDLTAKYQEFGKIQNLHLNLDRRTGYVKGYCLIEYLEYSMAKNAIDATSKSELLGLQIFADFAFVKGLGDSSSSSVQLAK